MKPVLIFLRIGEAPCQPAPKSRSDGYVLPIVMVVMFVGVMIGLGRLELFRYQCQIRFDRQREIERVLATRSALRWLEEQNRPPEATSNFTYRSASGRLIDVTVRPMPSIYPAPDNTAHLNIFRGFTNVPNVTMTSTDPTMHPNFIPPTQNPVWDLQIGSEGTNSIGHTGSVTIAMANLGSWLDDLYGRRYWVEPESVNAGDVYRLYITPSGEVLHAEGTSAIFIKHESGETTLWIKQATNALPEPLGVLISDDPEHGKGMQLAGNTITPFRWTEPGGPFGIYQFYTSYELPPNLVEAFKGKDITLTLEVEAHSANPGVNSFRWIRVDPAYEYAIELGWELPQSVGRTSEVSTVVHLKPYDMDYDEAGKAFTYDSHGVSSDARRGLPLLEE